MWWLPASSLCSKTATKSLFPLKPCFLRHAYPVRQIQQYTANISLACSSFFIQNDYKIQTVNYMKKDLMMQAVSPDDFCEQIFMYKSICAPDPYFTSNVWAPYWSLSIYSGVSGASHVHDLCEFKWTCEVLSKWTWLMKSKEKTVWRRKEEAEHLVDIVPVEYMKSLVRRLKLMPWLARFIFGKHEAKEIVARWRIIWPMRYLNKQADRNGALTP